jgi:hypothetical protein
VAPLFGFEDDSAPRDAARGLYYPSAPFAALLAEDRFGTPDQNFSESELEWNHGASQDTRELKEAYVDLELLEARLWLRLGLQNTIWGKTELFRAQDQFNPQDLGLSSLPSLEDETSGRRRSNRSYTAETARIVPQRSARTRHSSPEAYRPACRCSGWVDR